MPKPPRQAGSGELEHDRLGQVVSEPRESGDAALCCHRGSALERACAAIQGRGHRCAVGGCLQIAVLVLFVDHRLDSQGLTGCGTGRRRRLDRQLGRRRGADGDRCGRVRGNARPGKLKCHRTGRVDREIREGADAILQRDRRDARNLDTAARAIAVTTVVLSVVSTLPYESSSTITGWVESACPAIADVDACVVTTSLAGSPEVTSIGFDAPVEKPPPEKLSVMVSFRSSLRLVNVPTPSFKLTSVVP